MSPVVESSHPPAVVLRLVNPIMRALLRSPLGGPLRKQFMVLRFNGRRTRRSYEVPVSAHRSGEQLYVLTAAPWRLNFRGGTTVEVTLDGTTTVMHGELEEDPRATAETYAGRIAELGVKRAQRDIGLKIHVPRTPTVEELAEPVRQEHLSVIHLTAERS